MLAKAELGDVLSAWTGLGYNRRAKFLHQAAHAIVDDYNSQLPTTEVELMKLPGVGAGTAGAIMAYAYNQPVVFLETNIRTVFIHHYFHDQSGIPDREIRQLVERTLDTERPREWYWALMDYGSHLKKTVGNLSRHSRSYSKQSKFEGSARQVRGQVIRSLSAQPKRSAELHAEISDERLDTVIADLLREGLIRRQGSNLSL
jgi:A/G-specific adenine glycosylase